MKRIKESVTIEVIVGIQIAITTERSSRDEMLKQYEEIRESLTLYNGEIVKEEKKFDSITLTIKIPDYFQRQAWIRKMEFYGD